MCIIGGRCYDNACQGECVQPKNLWTKMLNLCPNFKSAHGKDYVKVLKIQIDFSDEAAARKFDLIDPILDTEDVCKRLVQEYDEKIDDIIKGDRPISIEQMIETPAIIALHCFEGEMINEESRRLVELIF